MNIKNESTTNQRNLQLITLLVIIVLINVCVFSYRNNSHTINFMYGISTKYGSSYKMTENGSNTDTNCSLINTNSEQYSVLIDGVKYPKYVPRYLNASINFECMKKNNKNLIILLWNKFFGNTYYDYGPTAESFIKNGCPVSNCELTTDKSKIDKAHLVVTHMRDGIQSIPKSRPDLQRWVFLLYESPIHSGDFTQYNNIYNLTSTYKIDSDFPNFYVTSAPKTMTWERNTNFNTSFDFHGTKSKMAAALISNCNTQSRRKEYIDELKKYIEVNVFGNCGKPCPRGKSCKTKIAKEYKFFLAFENSICDDYITEKFFDLLFHDIIPVVRGGGKYDYYVPKSGYINAQDFETPKELADYLTYLSGNKTAYNEYFKWKEHVKFQKSIAFSTICDMCIKLNLDTVYGVKKNVINDIEQYWDREKNCKRPIDLIEII